MAEIVSRTKVGKSGAFAEKFRLIKKYKFSLLLILPAFLFVLVFAYLPLFGVIMAFQDFDIINGGFFGSSFVGLDNFRTIFTMPAFLGAIRNTVVYSAANLIVFTPFPILLALFFNELKNQRFKKVVQTISYLPFFLSWISVIGLFYTMFAMYGPVNDLRLFLFGANTERINIIMDHNYFLAVLLSSNLWKNVGWSTVIYMAAIAGIDGTLYEAAEIDGCNRFRKAVHITLPCMKETILLLFIISTGSLFNSNFEQIYGFQNIFTQQQTEVINTLVFRRGIEGGAYSLATALGLFQGVVTFGIVFVSNAIVKKLSGTGIW